MRRLLIVSLLALAGCQPDFDPASYLKDQDLRVIAIKAEPPEIVAGETTTLTPLIINGPATLDWAYCTIPAVPGSGNMINEECITSETAPHLVQLGQGDTMTVTMPEVNPFTGQLGLPDQTTGFYLPVRMIARAGDQKVISFYRLRYGITPARNTNPVITGLFVVTGDVDGGMPELTPIDPAVPLEVKLTEPLRVRAQVTPESAETYLKLIGDPREMMFEPDQELARFRWYAPAGAISEEVTGEARPDTVLDFAERPPPRFDLPFQLHVVVTDGRGGTDFATRTLILK
jgi:hypothetical protein